MKNAKDLIIDMKAEELLKKFHEGLNKLRGDETLSFVEAGVRVACELGYEISEDETKTFTAGLRNRRGEGKTQLSDEELDKVAGGECSFCDCYATYLWK